MKKKILIIAIAVCVYIFIIDSVKAVTIGGSNSGSAGGGATTSGNWQYWPEKGLNGWGFRITMLDTSTNKRVKNTKSVNVIKMKTKDGAAIYMTKNSHNKVSYIKVGISISLSQPSASEKKYINSVENIPDIFKKNGKKLDKYLEEDNYKNLKKYAKKTGYKCLDNPAHNDCSSLANHYIIAEPLTVVKISGKYYWLTGAELAALTNTSQLRAAYEALNNALYGGASGISNFSAGSTCSGTDKCRKVLTTKEMSGAGRYTLKQLYTDVQITKSWKTEGGSCTTSGNKATFRIRYQTKKKNGKWPSTWSTYKGNLTISGDNSLHVYIPDIPKRRYKVEEQKTSLGSSCSGFILKSTSNKLDKSTKNSKESVNFTYKKNKKVTVTFTNTIKKTVTQTKKLTVKVYKMQGGFKTLADGNTSALGFYFKRQYGGMAVRSTNNGDVPYNDSSYKAKLYIGYGYNDKNRENFKDLGYITNMWYYPDDNWEPIGKKYIVEHTNAGYTSCRTYGNYLYASDSMSCYNIYYNPGNGGTIRMWGGNSTTAPFITNKNERYFDKKDPMQGVEVELQDSNNSYEKVDSKITGTDGSVTFTVNPGSAYRAKITCDNCGGKNTYSKLMNRGSTTFVQGAASKSYTVSKTNNVDVNNEIIFLNNDKSPCQLDLDEISNRSYGNDDNLIKQDLLDLYYKYKGEMNYTKLLNFKPNDTLATIKSKISIYDNGSADSISCGAYSRSYTSSIRPSCEQTVLDVDDNDFKVADFVNQTNDSQNIANDLFPSSTGDHWHCYVKGYQINYDNKKAIANNQRLYNSSFLWPTINDNLVGNLQAMVVCAGNSSHDVDQIENKEYVSSLFKTIKLYDDNNDNVQNITIGKGVQDDDSGENYGQSFSVRPKGQKDCDPEKEDCSENANEMDAQDESETEYESGEVTYLTDASKCGESDDTTQAKETYYSDKVCYDSSGTPFCPDGYTLDEGEMACYTDTDTTEETDSSTQTTDTAFKYKVYILYYGLMYQNKYYADVSTGTVSEKTDGKLLGWGVPVPFNSKGGNIKFVYSFDTSNDIYKFLQASNSSMTGQTETSCAYTKTATTDLTDIGKNRFVTTSNPFPGKSGSGRKSGINWNSCYNALRYKMNQLSTVSCYDLYGEPLSGESSDYCPHGDVYCKYGDLNCNGQYDSFDSQAMSYLLNYNEKRKFYRDVTWANNADHTDILRRLVDLNQDNRVDELDASLFLTWLFYKVNDGRLEDGTIIKFNDQTTYYGYDKDVDDPDEDQYNCESFINGILKNQDKDSGSQQTPIYSLTLSSKDLQNIRLYTKQSSDNVKKSYLNTDNLECDNKGYCKSQFITDLLNSSNGLTLSNKGGTCNISNRSDC